MTHYHDQPQTIIITPEAHPTALDIIVFGISLLAWTTIIFVCGYSCAAAICN